MKSDRYSTPRPTKESIVICSVVSQKGCEACLYKHSAKRIPARYITKQPRLHWVNIFLIINLCTVLIVAYFPRCRIGANQSRYCQATVDCPFSLCTYIPVAIDSDRSDSKNVSRVAKCNFCRVERTWMFDFAFSLPRPFVGKSGTNKRFPCYL